MRNTKRQYKHTMKTRYRKQRKTKKGGDGFITFLKNKTNSVSNKSNTEPYKTNTYANMDWESLNKEYQQTCPKRMGFKNTSNNCKEIEFELQKEKTQIEGKKKMYNLTTETSEDRHLLQHVNLPTPGKTKYDCKTIDPVQVSKLETLTDIDNVCCPSSRSLFGENNDKLCKKVKEIIKVKREYNFEPNEEEEDDDEAEGVYQSNDPLHGYREEEEVEDEEEDEDDAHDYRALKVSEIYKPETIPTILNVIKPTIATVKCRNNSEIMKNMPNVCISYEQFNNLINEMNDICSDDKYPVRLNLYSMVDNQLSTNFSDELADLKLAENLAKKRDEIIDNTVKYDALDKKVSAKVNNSKDIFTNQYNECESRDQDVIKGIKEDNNPTNPEVQSIFRSNNFDASDYLIAKPIKTITLINVILDTSLTKINNTLKTLETDIGFGTPNYKNAGALRSNNFLTNQRQLYELESIIKAECNAIRQKEEYNLVKSIWNSEISNKNEEIAKVLLIFSGYYFGKNNINYTMNSNKAYSEEYLDNVFNKNSDKNSPGSRYADIISEYSDSNIANNDNLLSNQPRFTDNKNPKYIWTPTTKTEVTVDSKNVKKLICKSTDMYPPDGKFEPIAELMKMSIQGRFGKKMGFSPEIQKLYDTLIKQRRACNATNTTLSSAWNTMRGRGVRNTRKGNRGKRKTQKKRGKRQTKRRSKK